jgi:hypothetical protein
MTNEVDLYPDDPRLQPDAVYVLEAIGEGSTFARTNGYFADGVGPETAALPLDWRERARELHLPTVPGVTVIVPDLDDVALSKAVAWREKDRDWLDDAVKLSLVDPTRMRSRVGRLPDRVEAIVRDDLDRRLRALEHLVVARPRADAEPIHAASLEAADRMAVLATLKGLAEPTLLARVRATVEALADPSLDAGERHRLDCGLAIASGELRRRGLPEPGQTPTTGQCAGTWSSET